MKRWKLVACSASIALAAFLAGVWVQNGTTARADDTPGFPVPKPSPEHAMLKKDVGVWDASVESGTPDGKKDVSEGVETNKMLGGLWLITDFKGKFGGAPFEGHGVVGYDANKKKYIGTWVDSMSTGISTMEETWDAAKKTMSGTMEGPDESGKMMKMKSATVWKDDDHRVFTMSMTGPDGKDMPMMTISYTRRAGAK